MTRSVEDDVLSLQRLAGNRAVARLLASSLEVTAVDHPFERQAELAARLGPGRGARIGAELAAPAQRRPSPLATGAGAALDGAARRRMGPYAGGTLDQVRVHTGGDADALTASMGAEALTHGTDVFVSREHYRPGTERGDSLLAHEAAHATGAAAASRLVHLKRSNKYLDFLRIKKKDTHIAREIATRVLGKVGATDLAKKVITDKQTGEEYDTYGHWWIEAGSLPDPANLASWHPAESYGWWPSTSVGLKQTLKIERVEGALNQGSAKDPHHGEGAETEYHPVMEVDDAADYATVRDQVVGEVRSFAHAFSGSWNWRLGWGKNCHTFVDRLKKKLKLHHQKAKGWLHGEGVKVAVPPPKSFEDIRKAWSADLKGNGFGMLEQIMGLMRSKFTLPELSALDDAQKTELVSMVNDGVEGWNRVRADDLNDALSHAFAGQDGGAGFDVFSSRHVLPEGGGSGGSGSVPSGFDLDAFVDGLKRGDVHKLQADLVGDKTTVTAQTEVLVVMTKDDKVQIELPRTIGGGRLWVEAAKLAKAFGAA
ncbi:MAG: DUF4157 domain-containing protein [Acidimicrobiales bacterium]